MAGLAGDQPVKMASYKNIFDISGKVALVTGAAGFLGIHIAKGLAEFGAKVVLLDSNAASLVTTREKGPFTNYVILLEKELPGTKFHTIECDITCGENVCVAIDRVLGEHQRIDILVNTACTKGEDPKKFYSPSESYDFDTYKQVHSVNVDGYFLVAQKVGKSMLERRSGVIVQLASVFGSVGVDQSLYEGATLLGQPINTPPSISVAKSAVVGLSRHLATEWGPKGIRVNTVSPGVVYNGQNEKFRQKYSDSVPAKLMGKPGDIVGAVLYLVSPAGSYVNGHDLVVDGGFSVW